MNPPDYSDQLRRTAKHHDAAAKRVTSGMPDEPLDRLAYLAGMIESADRELWRTVDDARSSGVTWAEIGTAIGKHGDGARQAWLRRQD